MILTTKERDALAAALRLLATALGNKLVVPNDGDIGDILTDSASHDGLSADEVSALCEDILDSDGICLIGI